MAANPKTPVEPTIIEAVHRYEERGFDAQMSVQPGATVHCYACNQASDAREVHMLHTARTEGTSDPGDMAVIAAIECPKCGAKGTLVLPYGPTATADDAAALRRLIDDRTVGAPT